jgi:hypothetical protein
VPVSVLPAVLQDLGVYSLSTPNQALLPPGLDIGGIGSPNASILLPPRIEDPNAKDGVGSGIGAIEAPSKGMVPVIPGLPGVGDAKGVGQIEKPKGSVENHSDNAIKALYFTITGGAAHEATIKKLLEIADLLRIELEDINGNYWKDLILQGKALGDAEVRFAADQLGKAIIGVAGKSNLLDSKYQALLIRFNGDTSGWSAPAEFGIKLDLLLMLNQGVASGNMSNVKKLLDSFGSDILLFKSGSLLAIEVANRLRFNVPKQVAFYFPASDFFHRKFEPFSTMLGQFGWANKLGWNTTSLSAAAAGGLQAALADGVQNISQQKANEIINAGNQANSRRNGRDLENLHNTDHPLRPLASSCRNSFSPTTPVTTALGFTAISTLAIGTPVLAFNEQTGDTGYYPVTQTHKNQDDAITYLNISGEAVETTPNHPFYVAKPVDNSQRPTIKGHEDLSQRWVGAGDLKVGDQIKQAGGKDGTVNFVQTLAKPATMYNLTVAQAHTYYVGSGQWLVHNARLQDCDVFDIIPYKDNLADVNKARVAQGLEPLEKHHGVMDEWAKAHLGNSGYSSRQAPTIALTESQHEATKEVYREWLRANYGKPVGVSPDWSNMSPQTIQKLADDMLGAAGIASGVRRSYYSTWHNYIYSLK